MLYTKERYDVAVSNSVDDARHANGEAIRGKRGTWAGS